MSEQTPEQVSEQPPEPGPQHGPQLTPDRLDPARAASASGAAASASGAAASASGASVAHDAPQVDTRRYGWMIGIFGLILVITASVYQFVHNGVGGPGVVAGKRLHTFVAPLASTGPDKVANTNPRCDPAHPNPLALNVCGRTPLVLAFFVTGQDKCVRAVDTLQRVAKEFPAGRVQFAAVAIRAGKAATEALVRSRGWTIPVAFDRDGAVGEVYGAEICPMIELARGNGIVADRLIGEHWLSTPALAERVHLMLSR